MKERTFKERLTDTVANTLSDFIDSHVAAALPEGEGFAVTINILKRGVAEEKAVVLMVATICDCDSPSCVYRGALDLCRDLIEARLSEKASRSGVPQTEEIEGEQ